MSNRVSFKCPAKINSFLKIVGKENDYHQLESTLTTIDLFDDLVVEHISNTETNIVLEGEFGDRLDPKDNLFVEILDYFHKQFLVPKNLKITLVKNIPVAAGLGGGSSNAAYFMMALNSMFNLHLSNKKLQELSFNFGSDIAFFIATKGSALIKGRGQIDTILSKPEKQKILLVNPRKALSTKEVFENFNGSRDKNSDNDLQETAIKLMPEIKTILDALKNNKASIAKMSGSGPSCFATFDSDEELEECYRYFVENFPEYFVVIA
ncbi:MAG: 4-(cytidine 5'-diphospho)-2-C-methyl-D-erythritol kinase [Rickettsiales bacterium]|nr:4-(cytidine 5'-diphospho)-2-C-methyl-D-erythritol kinase [Rickettsiales bacterium]